MANANLFQSLKDKFFVPAADTANMEGAAAYAYPAKHRLAQYAATGCLSNTFYAGAEAQLDTVLELCNEVEPEFIARCAVYARRRSYMKDMPALLLAMLAARNASELAPAFAQVADNGKMLRNFVQILRSGAVGRKSLGTRPKKLVQAWLNTASEQRLLAASVGNSPSLADVVKMVHPKPAEAWRAAFFAWLIGKPFEAADLPPATRAFEAYKRDRSQPLPDVPFQMLTALDLDAQDWATIALQGGWHMVRMNLNSFARHGVFEREGMSDAIAHKLRDREAIARAKVFPYQLLAAFKAASAEVPVQVREALQDAMEIALTNVPQLEGKVVLCPDVSGSMSCPVSGIGSGTASKVRCIDAAALAAAAILRKNPDARVLPFEARVVSCELDPQATVMANATRLADIGGGGTDCSAPLALLNRQRARADLVIMVSDNQAWLGAAHSGTPTMLEWRKFKQRNPRARLVCIDIAPYGSTQAPEAPDVLNIGGFSDDVFKLLASFAAGRMAPGHWVAEIESTPL